jgi:hypothetical protein
MAFYHNRLKPIVAREALATIGEATIGKTSVIGHVLHIRLKPIVARGTLATIGEATIGKT